MNILIVNDDGIQAAGILALVQSLSHMGDIFVAAPHTQRSGASQSITIHDEIEVKPVVVPGAKKAIATTGTPADCTKIGLQFFEAEGDRMDLIVSGINLGTNLGVDTLYSGTIGAAMEGSLEGIHAIAVSIDSFVPTDFTVACEVVSDAIPFMMRETGPDTILNINVPDLPREEIKGIRHTVLGRRYYKDIFVPQGNGTYRMDGSPCTPEVEGEDIDITAIYDGYVSITPLHVDYTQHALKNRVSNMDIVVRKEPKY